MIMRTILRRIPAGLATAALLVALAGCSKDTTAAQVAALNTSNIQRLANMYSAFQNYRGGHGPKDDQEFKAFITNFDPPKLQMRGIDPRSMDALFTSERDSKPFKIRYQVGGGKGSVAPVIFEEVGKEGKKQVAFTGNSKVEELDGATYAELWAGKTRPAADPKESGRPPGDIPKGAPKGPPGGIPQGPPAK
jgi:hypothetical protein